MPAVAAVPTQKPNFPPGTLYVTFWKAKPDGSEMELSGFVGWDGHKYVFDFARPNPNFIQSVMESHVPDGKQGFVTADHPEAFLAGLKYQYRNVYTTAGSVQQV